MIDAIMGNLAPGAPGSTQPGEKKGKGLGEIFQGLLAMSAAQVTTAIHGETVSAEGEPLTDILTSKETVDMQALIMQWNMYQGLQEEQALYLDTEQLMDAETMVLSVHSDQEDENHERVLPLPENTVHTGSLKTSYRMLTHTASESAHYLQANRTQAVFLQQHLLSVRIENAEAAETGESTRQMEQDPSIEDSLIQDAAAPSTQNIEALEQMHNENSLRPSADHIQPIATYPLPMNTQSGGVDSPVVSVLHENGTLRASENFFDDLMERISLSMKQDRQEIEVQLKPEYLGRLILKVAFDEGALAARLTVESTQMKEYMMLHMKELKDNLLQQGMVFTQLDVDVGERQGFHGQQRHRDPDHGAPTWTQLPSQEDGFRNLIHTAADGSGFDTFA